MTTPEQTLQTLARVDPGYPAFAATLPAGLARSGEALPPELADDVLALLRAERPEIFPLLDVPTPAKFTIDPLTAAGVLAAILFLLRTHVKIEGKHILFEHEPMPSELLEKVLDALRSLFGGE